MKVFRYVTLVHPSARAVFSAIMMHLAEEYAFRRCLEADVTSTKSTAFGVSAFLLLAGSIGFGQQQDRDLSGIHGIPVEGHDILAGVEIVGTKQLDLSRAGWEKLQKRLRENGANLQVGWPLETPTLCRFKEVVRDVMSDKGFLDVEVTHDMLGLIRFGGRVN